MDVHTYVHMCSLFNNVLMIMVHIIMGHAFCDVEMVGDFVLITHLRRTYHIK